MKRNDKPAERLPIRPGPADISATRRVDVRELLGDGRELRILHGSEEYRLSLTSKGRLILTK